jgi:hypothetical protein
MPSLDYFLVARSVVIDKFTNAVSVHSIVDEITPKRLPAVFMQLTALVGLRADEAELGQQSSYRIRVRLPGEDHPVESRAEFRVDYSRLRFVSHFFGVRVSAPGDVTFTLFLDDREVASHPVLVHQPESRVQPDGWLVYQEKPPGRVSRRLRPNARRR